jgi:hypothetical protein
MITITIGETIDCITRVVRQLTETPNDGININMLSKTSGFYFVIPPSASSIVIITFRLQRRYKSFFKSRKNFVNTDYSGGTREGVWTQVL